MEQELLTKPSREAYRLAEAAALEEMESEKDNDSLKQSWIRLANQLQIENIPKYKISTMGKKIIIEKKRELLKKLNSSQQQIDEVTLSGWWYDVMNGIGCIDPHYSHLGPDPDRKIVPLTEYEKENFEYIEIIKETIKFLKDIVLQKLKTNKFMSLLNEQDDKVTIALHDWRAQLEIAESFFDHKEKIPVNTQHILLHAIGTMSSNNSAAEEYFRLRDKAHHLTGKQLSKYRSGLIKTGLAIFNPKDRVTAILWKYFGVQCVQCKSWKVEQLSQTPTNTKVICLECKNKFEVDSTARCNFCSFPFFDDEIAFIKKGNKCPNCKEELPEYLINHILN